MNDAKKAPVSYLTYTRRHFVRPCKRAICTYVHIYRRPVLFRIRRVPETHVVASPPLHVALNPLRRDIHHVMVVAPVEPLRPVDERRMVPCVGVRVRNVVHLHRSMVRRTQRDRRLTALRRWGLRGSGRYPRLPSVHVHCMTGLSSVRV